MSSVWIVTEYDCEGCGTVLGVFDSEEKAVDCKRAYGLSEVERIRKVFEAPPKVTFARLPDDWAPGQAERAVRARQARVDADVEIEKHEVL